MVSNCWEISRIFSRRCAIETPTRTKINAHNAAFIENGTLRADYPSQCPRYIKAKRAGLISEQVPKIYTAVGEIDEQSYFHQLQAQYPGAVIEYNEPIKKGFVRGEISIKPDYVVHWEGRKIVYEKKSTIASSGRLKTIRKGEYRQGHIAQLALGMMLVEANEGVLAYNYWQFDKSAKTFHTNEAREYQVLIDNGRIVIDGKDSGLTVQGLRNHIEAQVSDKLPIRANQDMCRWCPLRQHCDNVSDLDEFLDMEPMALPPRKEPVIFKPKR